MFLAKNLCCLLTLLTILNLFKPGYAANIPLRKLKLDKPLTGIAIVGEKQDYYKLGSQELPPNGLLTLPANENIKIYLQDDAGEDDDPDVSRFDSEDVFRLCKQSEYLVQAIIMVRCQDTIRINRALGYLKSQKELRAFDAYMCRFDSNNLRVLANMPSLTTFSLGRSEYFGKVSFGSLLKTSAIQNILVWQSNINNMFSEFSKMNNLKTVRIQETMLRNSDFLNIDENSSINKIHLQKISFTKKDTKGILGNLGKLNHLEELIVESFASNSLDYLSLNQLKNVKRLSLINTNITPEDLYHISKMNKLEELNLFEQNCLMEADFSCFKGLDRLRVIRFRNTSISDAALKNLKKITNVKIHIEDNQP